MLEKGEASETRKTNKTERTETTNEHDPLRNTRRAEPTATYNRYSLLATGDDNGNEDSDSSNASEQHNGTDNITPHYTTLQEAQTEQTTATETPTDNDDRG